MPQSPDGLLVVEFDPATAAVSLTVKGSLWPSPVAYITITRTPTGQPTVPVRGVEMRQVLGGWYVGSDHEMPLDMDVRYEVIGYDAFGDEVAPARVNWATDPRLTATTMTTQGATVTDTRPSSGGPDGGSFFRRTMTTANTSSPMTMPVAGVGTAGIPVIGGQSYEGSWHARKSPTGGPTTRLDLVWYNAAGTQISSSTGAANSLGSTWEQFFRSVVAPADAAFVRPVPTWSGTGQVGQTLDLAMFQWEVPAPEFSYFDGTYPGAQWLGAANASRSLLPYGARAAVTISTTGAEWGVWLKAPGRADLTMRAQLRDRGDVASPTIGGTYQVHDGAEVAAWSGRAGDRVTLQLQTRTTAQDAALRTLLNTTRVLLVQTGHPAEIGDGTGTDWWFVENPTQANPQRYVPSGDYALRYHTLQLVRTTAPAGEGVAYTGETYSTVYGEFATYDAVMSGAPTYQHLMTGSS